MENALSIEKSVVSNLIESRKMSSSEVLKDYNCKNDKVIFADFNQLKNLSDKLDVPVKDFLIENDLDHGVKIGRKNDAFSRTVERKGEKYYTYNHLATTKVEPNLMALRVNLHCQNKDKVVLNAGHGSKEIVYVTKGKVKMDWEHNNERKSTELDIGDSAYVSPGVPHSFIALEKDSELIAINY